MDDDHYDGMLDWASWLRRRARIQERIQTSQKSLDESAASVVRLTASEICGRPGVAGHPTASTPVARLIFDKIDVLPPPKGLATWLSPRKNEPEEDYVETR